MESEESNGVEEMSRFRALRAPIVPIRPHPAHDRQPNPQADLCIGVRQLRAHPRHLAAYLLREADIKASCWPHAESSPGGHQINRGRIAAVAGIMERHFRI